MKLSEYVKQDDYLSEAEESEWLETLSAELMRTTYRGYLLRHTFFSDMKSLLTHHDYLLRQAESPIEEEFLNALMVKSNEHGMPVVHSDYELAAASDGREPFGCGLYIYPQFEIKGAKNYRVDFLLLSKQRWPGGGVHKVIVECDGHDYHERTKEQAKKDKSRDRDLLIRGFHVFRFTGSEIHNDAPECADQVAAYMSRYRKPGGSK